MASQHPEPVADQRQDGGGGKDRRHDVQHTKKQAVQWTDGLVDGGQHAVIGAVQDKHLHGGEKRKEKRGERGRRKK